MTVDQMVSAQIELKRKIFALQSSKAADRLQQIAQLQAEYDNLKLAMSRRKMRTSALKQTKQKRGRKMKFCPNCRRRMYAYRDTTTCWYCEHDGLVPATEDKTKCEPGKERHFKQCPQCKAIVHTYKHKHTCRKCGRSGLVQVKKTKGKWVRA
jgi:hypothetical protein